jgi:cation:H+ antiporter
MLLYVFLIAGFVLLITGANFLVNGASSIARRFRVSDLVIALTIVAFGTSAPELFVNIFASARGNTDIAVGNILGSNTANILLILGVSSLIYPLTVTKGTVWKEIPFSLLAIIVVGVMANDRLIDKSDSSIVQRADGLVLLSFFIIFLYYFVSIAKTTGRREESVPPKHYGLLRSMLWVMFGLIGLTIGGTWIVDGAVRLAMRLGMGQSLVGLTIVAAGTSLPELATSAVAAYKKNAEIAVGNVVGSNIFNIFFVLAMSAIIKPLPFKETNNTDIGMVILAELLLFAFMFTGRRRLLDRWEGAVFLILYAAYIIFLAVR